MGILGEFKQQNLNCHFENYFGFFAILQAIWLFYTNFFVILLAF